MRLRNGGGLPGWLIRESRPVTDSHFKRTRPSVAGSVARVKRRFAVATGCSARFSGHFRAGADTIGVRKSLSYVS